MPPDEVVGASGATYVLDEELGRGGEGCVRAVRGNPRVVVKVYHRPRQAQFEKLEAMVRGGSAALAALTAWPSEIVFTGDTFRGFVMPRLDDTFRPVHLLYGPRSRLRAFPSAGVEFLCHVAAETARAFAVVHAHGQVVGDVNHENVFVGRARGAVRLIDCDSFQITADGVVHHCTVGVSTHLPPELQGADLGVVVRSADHDCFGLAVMLFQLLLMGRHPFAGVFEGPGDLPLETAIAERRYPYAHDAAARGVRPPPSAIDIDVWGPDVRALFERAFAGPVDAARPSAREWAAALEALREGLEPCPKSPSHGVPAQRGACPWCALEARTGVLLFGGLASRPVGHDDVGAVWDRIVRLSSAPHLALPPLGFANLGAQWAAIERVQAPPTLNSRTPPLPTVPAPPDVRARVREWRWRRTKADLAGMAILLVLLGGLFAALHAGSALAGLASLASLGVGGPYLARLLGSHPRNDPALVSELRARRVAAERRYATALVHWQQTMVGELFLKRRNELTAQRNVYRNLPAKWEQLTRRMGPGPALQARFDALAEVYHQHERLGDTGAWQPELGLLRARLERGLAEIEQLAYERALDETEPLRRQKAEAEAALGRGAEQLAGLRAQVLAARATAGPRLAEAAEELSRARAASELGGEG